MDIVIDFDGTCVTNDYPNIGDDIGAEPVLHELVRNGHRLILLTMRTTHPKATFEPGKMHLPMKSRDMEDSLTAAVQWFRKRNIPLYGINENPHQRTWSISRKVFGHLYIDDAGFGVPLVTGRHKKPYVDWVEVRRTLVKNGTIDIFKS